jgi:hypothetical protein
MSELYGGVKTNQKSQAVDIEALRKLNNLVVYLQANGLMFHEITERNLGAQKYVDIKVSIKLA